MVQPTGTSPVPPTPDAAIMRRLGYIRLLYQQAVTQSHAPAPLNFSTVLAFYDVVEYFFIVAVAHLGDPQGLDLRRPFAENAVKFRAPDGAPLYSLDAVRRLAHDRNGFKHNGSIPGPDQVEEARRDATAFLEGNCPRLFGLGFSQVSMLHIVPQDAVRDHLVAGRTAADAGDLDAAMAEQTLAFDRLITDWGRGKRLPGSSFRSASFDLSTDMYPRRSRIRSPYGRSDHSIASAFDSLTNSINDGFEKADEELDAIRDILRIQIAGVDLAGYVRFAMLAPHIARSANGESSAIHVEGQLHYTPENYDLCEMFVVDSALRLGVRDFRLWMPQTYGDWDRAKAAMEANGGRLPDDMD
jgi:hypothetical protein